MSVYRVESGGRAPAGLSAGDEVVTGGGTYRITGVNADGSYQSQLVNKNQTTRNYGGSYQTRNSPYTMSGVSDYTRSKLNGLEGGYTPSGSVQAAQAYLEQVKASKPGAYQSRWDDELTSLYDQIRNRKKFSYDMGTDPLYQQYREQYQRLGRLAMQDTLGQAAAMTGGFGSSYGQTAAQQAYRQQMANLGDKASSLYDKARSEYDRQGTADKQAYDLLLQRENSSQNQYKQNLAAWEAENQRLWNRYDQARSDDYGAYRDEIKDDQWLREFQQAQEQFYEKLRRQYGY